MSVYYWIGGNGAWTNPNDWSPSGVPNGGDLVLFSEAGNAYDVTTGTSVASLIVIESASATLEDNGSLFGATIDLETGTLTVDADDTLTGTMFLTGGTMNVAGTLLSSTIVLNGGTLNLEAASTLSNVVFDGVLNVMNTNPIYVAGSLVVNDVTGANPGVVNIVDDQLNFSDDDLLDAMTINLGSLVSGDGGYLALAPQGDGGDASIVLTFGDGAVVNSYGDGDAIFVANGDNASSIINYGAIHQSNANGSLDINLSTGNFINSGLIDSYFGGIVYIFAPTMRNAGILSIGDGSTLDTHIDALTANISSRINIGAGSVWSVSGDNGTPTLRNYGAIALAGGSISGASGLVFSNLASATITGYGSISQPTLVNQGLIEVSGGTLTLSTTITGAGVLKVDTYATASLGANVTQSVVTEAVNGHISLANKYSLNVVGSASLAGTVYGQGTFVIDAGASTTMGNGATDSGGGIVNAGTFSLGASNLTAPIKASAIRIQNSGAINVTGAANEQALLAIGAYANFGTTGVVTGAVTLAGDSAISFTSGSFTSIASGASLRLRASDAYLEDATALGSNSALSLFTTNMGDLALDDGAKITTSRALSNQATLTLDASTGDGGSHLTANAGFSNSGLMTIGNAALSAASGVSTTTFTNTGSVTLQGGSTVKASLSTSSGFVNNGSFAVSSGAAEVAGAVSGTGAVFLGIGSTLTYDNGVGAGQTVYFQTSDVLALKSASAFNGQIEGFGNSGDSLDLISLAHTGASFNFVENSQTTGGVLTLTSGSQSAQLSLFGSYNNGDFSLAADAGTGTLVKFV